MKRNSLFKNHLLMVNRKQRTVIPVENIIMLEGRINYSIFHLKHGKTRIYARSIRHFEASLLPQHFIRVHRGFLVNPSFVIGYNKAENTLSLHNNLKASISRRRLINLPNEFLS